jgi:hypothetical protein
MTRRAPLVAIPLAVPLTTIAFALAGAADTPPAAQPPEPLHSDARRPPAPARETVTATSTSRRRPSTSAPSPCARRTAAR